MSGWRAPISDEYGSALDHDKPIEFSMDGLDFTGFAGDTLASALLASGQMVLGRSFKYHRARGLWGAGAEEPNVILDVTENGCRTPNVRATLQPLRQGLVARSVNTSPNAANDRMRWLDRMHRFLPAGFYYKTFMRPSWMRWEPMIRRMAGLGRLDPEHAPCAGVAQINAQAELLIIGAGIAGLTAARAAARRGVAVWLVDDQGAIGGSLRWRDAQIDGVPWRDWAMDTVALVRSAGGRILLNTSVWGAFDHGLFSLWERRTEGSTGSDTDDSSSHSHADRLWRVRAASCILAAGALERPLWFANNDLPGIMSADAALQYLRLQAAVCGRKVVIATNNDSAWPVASALHRVGCEVTVVDARVQGPAEIEGVTVLRNQRVQAASGRDRVSKVHLEKTILDADALLLAGGWTPSVHLFMQAGGKLDWNEQIDALVPRTGTAPMRVVGAANGTSSLQAILDEAHKAAEGEGVAPVVSSMVDQDRAYAPLSIRPDPALPGRQWIDLQNDVTLKDVALAAREGFRSVEHLKRYTTLGMATDQGRTSNFAGLAAMAAITGRTIEQTGTTTYRPPFVPLPLSLVAGRRRGELFNPLKRLHLEPAYREVGAQFREYGGWLRPACFGEGDEVLLAQEEALVARQNVVLYDASPLGKIEVVGPGAAQLLDFCFYSRLSTLAPGRARYALMLTESGVVYDDGVVLRLGPERFLVSASSSHVSGVRLRLEEIRQDRFDPSGVFLHDVTANWVTIAVAGPGARELLRLAGLPLDLSDEALPPMSLWEGRWEERVCRIVRVSFTGERSYEVSVPLRHAAFAHDRLTRALETLGGLQIGMEAVLILRAEKGYILIGKDTDGSTQPQDLGWSMPRDKREDEYIGKRSLFTPEAQRAQRRQLVGLQAVDSEQPLITGSHLVPDSGQRRSLGFLTSSYFSPVLGRGVALALLEEGLSRIGQTVNVFHQGELRRATVTSACAYDADGTRLQAEQSQSQSHRSQLASECDVRALRRADPCERGIEMSWDNKADKSDKTGNALLPGVVIDEPSLRVTLRAAAGATLISGDLQAAINTLAPDAVILGLGAKLDSQTFALRLARDRALLVTAAPLLESGNERHGWQSDAVANAVANAFVSSAADDAWTFLEVSGSLAAMAMSEGCAADLNSGSPSAAVLFATHTCLLVRHGDGFLLAVESSSRMALLNWLKAVAGNTSDPVNQDSVINGH